MHPDIANALAAEVSGTSIIYTRALSWPDLILPFVVFYSATPKCSWDTKKTMYPDNARELASEVASITSTPTVHTILPWSQLSWASKATKNSQAPFVASCTSSTHVVLLSVSKCRWETRQFWTMPECYIYVASYKYVASEVASIFLHPHSPHHPSLITIKLSSKDDEQLKKSECLI